MAYKTKKNLVCNYDYYYEVESTAIAKLAHDPENQTMQVWFQHGGVYILENVNTLKFNNLLNANSIGSYYYHKFRKEAGKYPATRIDAGDAGYL